MTYTDVAIMMQHCCKESGRSLFCVEGVSLCVRVCVRARACACVVLIIHCTLVPSSKKLHHYQHTCFCYFINLIKKKPLASSQGRIFLFCFQFVVFLKKQTNKKTKQNRIRLNLGCNTTIHLLQLLANCYQTHAFTCTDLIADCSTT